MQRAAILAAILGKEADVKLHLSAKIVCAKFGYKTPDGLGGVSVHTHRQTHRQTPTQTDRTKNMSPVSPKGPSTAGEPLCGSDTF